jgi:alkaline phosphatase D
LSVTINTVTFMQFKVANTFIDAHFPDDPNFSPVEPAENSDGIYVTLDQWDGYQAERLAITNAFSDVENFVTITGDIHSHLTGYIKPDYDEPAATPGNAHIKYFNSDNHGYNLVEMTKGSLLCTMMGLVSTDPNEPNPIRVEDDSRVQKTEIKQFKVDAGAFVPLPPA